jgi:hypothetical protein
MLLTIKKTDKRHTGRDLWHYVVVVEAKRYSGLAGRGQRILDLNEIRNWCVQTWGSSCELELWMVANGTTDSTNLNQHWCWHTNYDNYKIYLRSDKEANWFKLKWL